MRRLGAVQRDTGGSFALALVGIDGMGADLLPPGTEETVLRGLTARLTRALRGEDWLARGKDGDFVVLVTGTIAEAPAIGATTAIAPTAIPR